MLYTTIYNAVLTWKVKMCVFDKALGPGVLEPIAFLQWYLTWGVGIHCTCTMCF